MNFYEVQRRDIKTLSGFALSAKLDENLLISRNLCISGTLVGVCILTIACTLSETIN